MCVGLVGLVLFIGFAYQFRGNPYRGELRAGLIFASILVVACSCLLVLQLADGRPVIWSIGSGTSLVLFLWAEGVLVRGWKGAKTSQEAVPYRSFALVFLLSVAAVGVYFLRDIGVVSAALACVLSSVLYLSTLVGFTLVYVNNAASPTTFRVKIAGASLFTVLAVLTVMWTAIGSSSESDPILVRDVGSAVPAANVTTALPIEGAELAHLQDVQQRIIRCNYCIIGSSLFVLLFFPAFFQVSLVEPLNALLKAVDKVDNEGCRDVHLPLRFNDEIGRLTLSFNNMMSSLKAAEDDVRCYTESLEWKVQERTAELGTKNEENERLLLNILPASIAERLKRGEEIIADACSEVSILFADIVNFTELSSRVPARELVELLSDLISEFDQLAEKHGVEKIKTIGDAYMAVAGLPHPRADHAQAAVSLALDMLSAAERRQTPDGKRLQLRIGINSGPVIAGVIGKHKFAYDLWGDTVNTASRMESYGKPGRIQVTEATRKLLAKQYQCESRGDIEIKGKGCMATYLVVTGQEDLRENHPSSWRIGATADKLTTLVLPEFMPMPRNRVWAAAPLRVGGG
jgi:class 3 adenylate cyclase/HAMP domain-containing protein